MRPRGKFFLWGAFLLSTLSPRRLPDFWGCTDELTIGLVLPHCHEFLGARGFSRGCGFMFVHVKIAVGTEWCLVVGCSSTRTVEGL